MCLLANRKEDINSNEVISSYILYTTLVQGNSNMKHFSDMEILLFIFFYVFSPLDATTHFYFHLYVYQNLFPWWNEVGNTLLYIYEKEKS